MDVAFEVVFPTTTEAYMSVNRGNNLRCSSCSPAADSVDIVEMAKSILIQAKIREAFLKCLRLTKPPGTNLLPFHYRNGHTTHTGPAR